MEVAREELKMSVSTSVCSRAVSFNTRQGMESGPDALLGLILIRSLCTPRISTTISGIEGEASPGGVGLVVMSSTENTEVNCRLRISALDWLSENSRPPFLCEDIPVLSQRIALTNFQKGLVSLSIKALLMIFRVASGQGKVRGKCYFSRSRKSLGIL